MYTMSSIVIDVCEGVELRRGNENDSHVPLLHLSNKQFSISMGLCGKPSSVRHQKGLHVMEGCPPARSQPLQWLACIVLFLAPQEGRPKYLPWASRL